MRSSGSTQAKVYSLPIREIGQSDGKGPESGVASSATGTEGHRAQALPFAQIYSDYFDMVWRALCRMGVAESQLEDALQEVFMTAHDRLDTFRGHSNLGTWLYGIARRVARNHRPKARTEFVDPLRLDEMVGPLDADHSASIEQREASRILQGLLAQLPTERSEILVLVELEQMTVAEAAEVLGENPNTLQSRLRLGREELAQAYSRLMAEQAWRRQCATHTGR